jgi:hypothetical protein
MGQEIATKATIGGRKRSGRVQLETDYLLWRGTERLKIPFSEMRSVEAVDGALVIRHRDGEAAFDLGSRAARWADKILHPPTVLDKLGVKQGQRVSVLGTPEGGFVDDVSKSTGEKISNRPRKDSDLIFLFGSTQHDMERMAKLRSSIKPDGAIWAIYPKGRKELTENDVIEAGRAAGMKDVKVARFSDTHTALKMVIPVSER